MSNFDMKVNKNVLTITIDLNKDSGPSKSGKTILIASSGPGVKCPDHPDVTIGLNVYRKPEKK